MLAFPLFLAISSEDYDSSMKKKYHIFYVSSSFLFVSLTVTDTIELEVEAIEKFYYISPLGVH